MNITIGGIYNFGEVYHLVLFEREASDRKMVECSVGKDIDGLLDVTNYGIETPNENWEFVKRITDEEYKQALNNFKNNIEPVIKGRKQKF